MEIKQSCFLKGKRRLRLLPDDRVEIEVKGGGTLTRDTRTNL